MTVIRQLQALVPKKNVSLTESGDHAIRAVLKSLKNSKTTMIMQDQGGWLTYKDYAQKEGFNIVEVKTDYGILDLEDLSNKVDYKSVLLVNSLTGYCAEQPMINIAAICAKKTCLVINDASGSIGTDTAKIGDIILGSFGKDKPVNLNYGGFIATNTSSFQQTFDQTKLPALQKELDNLPTRLSFLTAVHQKIKTDLSCHDIIHRDKHGINVIVKFNNEKEKQELIDYCAKNNYAYTVCPRYIRVNENAISIEVKRLK